MKDAENLAELLETHPLTKALLAEKAESVRKERLLAAAKLQAANDEAGRIIPKRQREVAALEADLAKHDQERAALLNKLTFAQVTLMEERQRLDRARSHAEAELLSNYDPRLDEAITFFRDHFEGLRVKDINKQTRSGISDLFAETKVIHIFSNGAAIQTAMAYCRAAISELERLKLTPDLDPDRIEALKKGIPDADALTETVGEKVLPGSRGINPRHLLASDSELFLEVGKDWRKIQTAHGKKVINTSAPFRNGVRLAAREFSP